MPDFSIIDRSSNGTLSIIASIATLVFRGVYAIGLFGVDFKCHKTATWVIPFSCPYESTWEVLFWCWLPHVFQASGVRIRPLLRRFCSVGDINDISYLCQKCNTKIFPPFSTISEKTHHFPTLAVFVQQRLVVYLGSVLHPKRCLGKTSDFWTWNFFSQRFGDSVGFFCRISRGCHTTELSM